MKKKKNAFLCTSNALCYMVKQIMLYTIVDTLEHIKVNLP